MPSVLLIDANTTTRLLTQRALEALGAEVRAQAAWDAGTEVGDAALVVASSGPAPEELWGWLEVPAGTPLIITAVQPERIQPPPEARSAALTVLARPFTPRALCAAAVDRLPALRPEGDLPFSAAASAPESRFDSMEMDIIVDEELQILDMEDLLLEEDEEEDAEDAAAALEDDGFEPISEEGDLPELSALLHTAELESLGSTEHFESGEEAWGSAEDLPGLSASAGRGGYEGEPTRQPEELAPHEATRMASMESIFPAQPAQPMEAPDDATRMAPLPELFRAAHAGISITPGPQLAREAERMEVDDASILAAYSQAPTMLGLEEPSGFGEPLRRPGRQLAPWATQLARDWEFIGLELDLDRRAELIQTAVVDIEPEPLGLGLSGVLAAPAAPEPEPTEGRLQGDLGLLRPVEVLRVIREQRLAGALELHDGGVAFRLTVQGDRLRYLEPRVPDADLLLGRLLLERGWVTPELVDVALRARDERPLGERLVLAGALSEESLEEALRWQARAYFSVICAMEQGRFVFRELRSGASLPPFGAAEPRPLNFPISTLLLEAQREASGAKARPAVPDDATRLSSAPPRPLTFGSERGKPVAPARPLQVTSEEDDAAELDAIVRRLEALMPLNPYGAGEGEG